MLSFLSVKQYLNDIFTLTDSNEWSMCCYFYRINQVIVLIESFCYGVYVASLNNLHTYFQRERGKEQKIEEKNKNEISSQWGELRWIAACYSIIDVHWTQQRMKSNEQQDDQQQQQNYTNNKYSYIYGCIYTSKSTRSKKKSDYHESITFHSQIIREHRMASHPIISYPIA